MHAYVQFASSADERMGRKKEKGKDTWKCLWSAQFDIHTKWRHLICVRWPTVMIARPAGMRRM